MTKSVRQISAEIPDPDKDKILNDIVVARMIHGQCGAINPSLLCMENGKYTKNYPRSFSKDTETNDDGYPLYKHRVPEDGGKTAIIKIKHINIVINNTWVVS